jgi:hypothetical protein
MAGAVMLIVAWLSVAESFNLGGDPIKKSLFSYRQIMYSLANDQGPML